jgi:predicted DCC family thiol-disulfide oxidoreductase YuxK
MRDLKIIYDGHCPFCRNYVALIRLREAAGPVELIDARAGHPLVATLQAQGFNFDEGMALVDGTQVHFGADCIHRIALLSTRSGLFNRFNAWVFRSPRVSALLYPVLRAGRNMALRLMRRSKINA